MDDRHSFTRRTATPRRMVPWLVELATNFPSFVRSYAPGAPLDPRTREQIILAVTGVNGCRYSAWIHGSWRAFLGEGAHDDVEQALLAYARACAEVGRPLPIDDLATLLEPEAVGSLRATVAGIEVANLVGNTADGALARLTGRRSFNPLALAREVLTVVVALPVAAPLFATAAAMRVATRVAPPLPDIDVGEPADANLLVHLLATTAPAYLSNAIVRIGFQAVPRPIAVGVRSGRAAATVRLRRGSLTIENGISRDALVVVEGDVESLLQTATGSIVRELGSIRIRPT